MSACIYFNVSRDEHNGTKTLDYVLRSKDENEIFWKGKVDLKDKPGWDTSILFLLSRLVTFKLNPVGFL